MSLVDCLNGMSCEAFMNVFFNAIKDSDEYVKDCYDDLVEKLLLRLSCSYNSEFIQLYRKHIFKFIKDNCDRLDIPDIGNSGFTATQDEVGEFLLCVYEGIVEYMNYSDSEQTV